MISKDFKENCIQPQWQANNSKHNQQQVATSYGNFSCFITSDFSTEISVSMQTIKWLGFRLSVFTQLFVFRLKQSENKQHFGFRFSFFSNFRFRFQFLAWQRELSSSVVDKIMTSLISIQIKNTDFHIMMYQNSRPKNKCVWSHISNEVIKISILSKMKVQSLLSMSKFSHVKLEGKLKREIFKCTMNHKKVYLNSKTEQQTERPEAELLSSWGKKKYTWLVILLTCEKRNSIFPSNHVF